MRLLYLKQSILISLVLFATVVYLPSSHMTSYCDQPQSLATQDCDQ
jgi:hypothetical protein